MQSQFLVFSTSNSKNSISGKTNNNSCYCYGYYYSRTSSSSSSSYYYYYYYYYYHHHHYHYYYYHRCYQYASCPFLIRATLGLGPFCVVVALLRNCIVEIPKPLNLLRC